MTKRSRLSALGLLGSLGLALLYAATADATGVVLNPGVLQYAVKFPSNSGDRQITGGTAYASGGGYSISTAISAGTSSQPSLTVESGKSYSTRITSSLATGETLNVNKTTTVVVPLKEPGGPVPTIPVSFETPVADVSITINILNGTVTNASFNASAWPSGWSYQTSKNANGLSGSSATVKMTVPQAAAQSMSGTVCGISGGLSDCESLPSKTVAVDAAGTSVTWDVTLNPIAAQQGTSAIQGVVSISGSPTWTSRGISLGGASNKSAGLAADGSYAFNNLFAGTYTLAPYLYLAAPYYFTMLARSSVSLPADTTLVKDLAATLAPVQFKVVPTGFFDNSVVQSTGAFSALYSNDAALPNAYAYDNTVTLPTGQFDLAVSPGQWRLGQVDYTLAEYDAAKPERRLNAVIRDTGSMGNFTVPSGGLALPDRIDELVETKIVFDVEEPFGEPEQLISDVYLGGSRWLNGITYQFHAWGPAVPLQRPALRIAAKPGTYGVQPKMTTNGSVVNFPSFNFTIADPVETPASPPGPGVPTDVAVTIPSPPVDLVFHNVNEGGLTVATVSPIGPMPPFNFQLTTNPPRYYDITTTADFSGSTVDVCIHYDPATVDPAEEPYLELYHFNEAADEWELITMSVDPDNNVVCGLTDSFSVFAIMKPKESDGDGVFDYQDNCPSVSNASQLDTDGDTQGDACDDDDDGDGLLDGADNCSRVPNADQANLDGDLLGDVCDPDDDNDGALDAIDNCPVLVNADQLDTDADGAGDACDDDDDGDGALDAADNCPLLANADQADLDGDAAGDVCDPDDDGDGVFDANDNCPRLANASQDDLDGDAMGDVCDPDDDGDGVDDPVDNCPTFANGDQLDTDSDMFGDVCDTDDDGDGVSDGADDCPLVPATLDADVDGCSDVAADMCPLVQSLGLSQGATNALCATAGQAASAGSSAQAATHVDAFIKQVQGLSHKVISTEAAALLITFAQNVKANLP